ncbi:MarR family transcriptional regulator [[Actinobacillus] muris]|uniref:MarR family transcriptional regulator n=1 Tax=Muribacter muris TaxID=67855 RepID=A0A0J5P8M7_9PAST|nr:MarR family transcriptional regulator [Muribacter muris]KMK51864.1 MarR family transcriptional regulator [[Actinobacillus] muris] [Muribacter muris]
MNPFDKLATLSAQLSQIYAQWAKQYDLTLNELHFLYHIGRYGQSSPTAIGDKWSLPKQTVTSVCKRLDERGFLQFLSDPQDKRSKLIGLTAKGQYFTQPLIERLTAAECAVAAAFGTEHCNTLLDKLDQLQQRLKQQLRLTQQEHIQ